METLGTKIQQKSATKFYCENCQYKTDRKCNFDDHLISMKHIRNADLATLGNKIQQNQQKNSELLKLSCEKCNKEFKTNSGLWKHKNKGDCLKNTYHSNENKEEPSDKQLIMMLIKENSELRKEQSDIKELILEIVKNGTHNTNTNTTHTNSHNKAFNLNFFLNETCKNAMNITDFVESIKLQLTDLMDVGELGYVDGISKIIVKNLNSLDETIRPIHCTDKKRETMYIKDEGQWEKDDDNKSRLKKAVKKVANKNIRLLPQFREKYPDYSNSYAKISNTYDKIVVEAMTSDDDKNEKIIKNISRVTTIRDK